MANRGLAVDRGRGRATTTAGGSPGGLGSESPSPNRGRGGIPLSFRGDVGDRGGGGGFFIRGGLLSLRGRGQASIFMHGQQAEIDPRIVDNSDKEVVASFNPTWDLSNQPLRPDFGADGKEIKIRTNFFPVQFYQQTPSLKLYTYHVNINPTSGNRVNRRVYELAERSSEWGQAGMIGRVVHDNNANLLSASLLPQPLIIRVPYYNEDESGPLRQGGEMFTLTIIFVQELDTGPIASYLAGQVHYRDYNLSPIVSALNLILRSLPQKLDISVWRNRYFSRNCRISERFRLGGGVEAWKGIYTSVRPTFKQLMVNVDVCAGLFYTPGNLVHAMNAFCDATLGARARINSFFRGVRIEVTHFGYRKIVRNIVPFTARTYSFDTPEYGHVTLEDYFRRKYNIQLQYPNLQLVDVGGETENYLPAELCDILPGQHCRRGPTISNQQFVTMSAAANRPPNIHGETTVKQLRHQLGLDVIRPELESFGITIGPDMAVIPGRILSKPGITYASSTAVSISDRALWNLVGVEFAVGAHLDNWTVLVIKDGLSRAEFTGGSDGDLHGVVSAFRHMCNTSGMRVTADPTYATAKLPSKAADRSDCMRRAAIQTIQDTLLNVKPKPAFILVMLANEDKAIYEGIKRLCDIRLDVTTVCVQSSKIRRHNPQYLANVSLKVNMKLGGVNHKLDENSGGWLRGVSTMVVGIDVLDPSPGSPLGCPSIAAVVASVDNDFAQYPVSLDIQLSRMEMIMNLKDMMVDRLKLFQKNNNGKLPERILIYRSNVSETQFNILSQMELPLIVEAFQAFSPRGSYRPKVAIVVCSKSRRVRFYPTEQDDAAGDGNPLPGTVVDRGITAIYNFDFFLQSHGNQVQGTARPTHYYLIHDEIRFTADEIQGVTNALCYMLARATQAVSLVSPAYYANLACRRGRCYLRNLLYGYVGEDESTASETQTGSEGSTGFKAQEEARRLWGWGVSGAGLKETMFYL